MNRTASLADARRSKGVLFYHLPKTAGTTLQAILRRGFKESATCPAHNWTSLLSLPPEELRHYQLFAGHFYGGIEEFLNRRVYAFTLLRDPVDRALSQYGQVLRDPSHYLHNHAIRLGTLEAFIEDPATQPTISDFQTRMLALEAQPQEIFGKLSASQRNAWELERVLEAMNYPICSTETLQRAIARLSVFKFVGLQEYLVESIALLCHDFNWPYPPIVTTENANPARPLGNQVATTTLQRLAEINQHDIALYNWAEKAFKVRLHEVLFNLLENRQTKSLPYLTFGQWLGVQPLDHSPIELERITESIYWRITKPVRLPINFFRMLMERRDHDANI